MSPCYSVFFFNFLIVSHDTYARAVWQNKLLGPHTPERVARQLGATANSVFYFLLFVLVCSWPAEKEKESNYFN